MFGSIGLHIERDTKKMCVCVCMTTTTTTKTLTITKKKTTRRKIETYYFYISTINQDKCLTLIINLSQIDYGDGDDYDLAYLRS